ncbi:MAG TPA: hypothetical protein VEU77_08550 [Candidatus Acidoferrales bacterium]|nr:hypothetical protein [Candidatus Acidoferrales bacterium]
MNERIDFYCAEPEHLAADSGEQLTMHKDRWAYCPSGAGEGHRWQATGGMNLTTLRQRLAERREASRSG